MSLSVIDKYVIKKEKDLLEYTKILESIITIEENKMWKSKKEFANFAKDIISIYAKTYYFQNNIHKDNPIEYSNDNINFVLKSIISYCQEHDQMKMLNTWKNETFLMSVIICTACYVDFASNIIDGDLQDTKAKFKYLLSYLRKTRILIIKDNKYFINDLFDEIKRNSNEDKKALEALNSDNYHNDYKMISNNPLYYEVNFSYNIPGITDFDEKLALEVLKEYTSKINEISYSLLEFDILKELISNKEMPTYVVRVNKDFKKSSLLKFFDNEYIKEYVKILIPWEDEIKYQNIIKEYKDIDVKFIYEFSKTDNVESTIFVNNMELLVDKEFINNNLDNKLAFDKMNLKLIVKNKEEL